MIKLNDEELVILGRILSRGAVERPVKSATYLFRTDIQVRESFAFEPGYRITRSFAPELFRR